MSAAEKVACPVCGEMVLRPFNCKLCGVPGCVYCRPGCTSAHMAFTFSIATPEKPRGKHPPAAVLTMKQAAGLPPPASASAELFPLPW